MAHMIPIYNSIIVVVLHNIIAVIRPSGHDCISVSKDGLLISVYCYLILCKIR